MVDIHSHILPGIDDGAENQSEARAMLSLQQKSGVDRIYLTPHFNPEVKDLDSFLQERTKAWHEVSADFDHLGKLQIRLGAEVCYCRELLSLDLRKLTLGETNYFLLEFPPYYPAYAVQTIEKLLGQGFVPILAHVERYSYFREEPELLKNLINLGALAQVSAQALFDKRDRHFAIGCLRHKLAQIVASDAHNTTDRKPCMELVHKLPKELKRLHDEFSTAVWENKLPAYAWATTANRRIFDKL